MIFCNEKGCWNIRHKEGKCRMHWADVVRGCLCLSMEWTPEQDIEFLKDWPKLEPVFIPEAYNKVNKDN